MNTLLICFSDLLSTSLRFAAPEPWLLAASNQGAQAVVLGLGLVLSLVFTALICGLYFLARYRQGASADDHNAIFRDLCRAHDLTGAERRLLKRLAMGLQLSSPGSLFVDSSLWRLPDGSDRHQRLSKAEWDKLLKLQRTLFLPPPAKVAT